ncbi:ABC-2 type transport system permease protein [Chitinophaga polysaccharea]|uniref:ABC-2 type transport system permease protein n=1 Tax=Chitinophaga polysaccharea TaxID=1293035 RepID=A0A561PUI0_9BACT|nr:Gldg family protein [Chitinophaga polysaccharea]TWF41760.1 ABC-2 type transport system permease protein [Chitinophaga polysaccharea]
MKMIFKIARTELRNLFYSPVAWFLTIAFMVQCGIYYTYALYPVAKWQEVLQQNTAKFKDFGLSMTNGIFLAPDGIFSNVLQNLYLFVPLLTMGLISREINNGTIKLLYSSPVKVREIVLGKYLAIMIYNLLLVGIVGIFMVTGLINIRHADYGVLLSAALGFYLLVCAYTAIGLFMSSLTTYQIVSAIGSFILIFVLSRIGGLWQKYDFVRDLTYFLSLSGRTTKMLRGLITTKDLVYFLVIVYMFVGFTLIKLKAGRESKPWYVKVGRYALIALTTLIVGYFTSRPGYIGYWDTTATKSNTLHANTQQIIRDMKGEPLEVTLYCNLFGGGVSRGLPENRNDYLWTLWEPYLRFKPDVKFNYVYYYDVADNDSTLYKTWVGKSAKEIAEKMCEGYDIKPSLFTPGPEVRKAIDLQPENYRLVMQLKYKGKTTFLRTFDDATFWPEEQQVAAAFKRLLQPSMPKTIFLTGNLERDITKKGEREYSYHSLAKDNRYSLINLGFDSDTLSADTHDIPADVTTLVLADPKTTLSTTTMDRVQQYLHKGGNMLILGEPGKQQMLNPLLQGLGVHMLDGTLIELSKDEMPHMVKPFITHEATDLSQEPILTLLKDGLKHGEEDSMPMLMPGVTGLTFTTDSGYTITPLLNTAAGKVWLKAGALVTDSVQPVYSPAEGDSQAPYYTTAVSLSRKVNNKEQRIIVSADADFMSNLRQGGAFLSRSYYSWLDYGNFPIYTPRPKAQDTLLTIGTTGAGILKIVYVWVLPGLVLLTGTVLLIRRKRK